MKTTIIAIIFSVFLCSSAIADNLPPPQISDFISVPATVKKDHAQQIRLGQFIAKLEETTLDEIREIIGIGSIDHSGDAGSSQYWLCYSIPGQHIWLISDGEMGGRDHVLTQVHAVSLNGSETHNAKCPSVPISHQPVAFGFGWIGTEKDVILKALGQPSGDDGNNLIYYHERQQKGPYKNEVVNWDVLSYIKLKIIDGRVTSLYVSHVTSY